MTTAPPALSPLIAASLRPRVAFVPVHAFHRAILEPVHALLREQFDCLFSNDAQAIIAFQPQVLVTADLLSAPLLAALPNTLLVFTRHGFVSKNFGQRVFGQMDVACVSSAWVREDCRQRGWQPLQGFWVTGFLPMDVVLRAPAAQKRKHKVLLYAPTFNPKLSAITPLGSEGFDALLQAQPELQLLVKPHPHTQREHAEGWACLRALAARHPQQARWIDPDDDIYRWLPEADVLLSDVSSVAFYFLALDRPIVLVDNPARAEERSAFDPQGPEWAWRDMAHCIDSPAGLAAAVAEALAHPQLRAAERAEYRQRVFGTLLDGRAAERLAAHISRLLAPAEAEREQVAAFWSRAASGMALRARAAQLETTLTAKLELHYEQLPRLTAAMKSDPLLKPELDRLLAAIHAARLRATRL